jgi:hypothetical protein
MIVPPGQRGAARVRIEGPGRGTVRDRPVAGPRAGSSTTFTNELAQASLPPAGPPATLATPVPLLALPPVEEPLARRREALRRGGRLLDALAAAQAALLDAVPAAEIARRLGQLTGRAGMTVADPELAALVAAIETRLAVEVAKLEAADRGPGAGCGG